jgi:hypothetical protein
VNLYLEPLLCKPSILPPYCIVCGVPATNAHHVIPGRRKDIRVPRLRLCGSGTTGCHGDAHAKRLHFRYRDGWEYLRTEPTRYEHALASKGWKRCTP